ncbi:hypothetical protein XENTR_v10022068 [Xenopus tropicalis]|nr:hypothetical protein XENTR_v10022068 [Xenopus tropicalis]
MLNCVFNWGWINNGCCPYPEDISVWYNRASLLSQYLWLQLNEIPQSMAPGVVVHICLLLKRALLLPEVMGELFRGGK